jgi:hypothetical protein
MTVPPPPLDLSQVDGISAGEVQLILGGFGQPHFEFWGRKSQLRLNRRPKMARKLGK